MKKLLLTLLLAAVSLWGKAQPYESIFGQNSTQWVFTFSNTSGPMQDTLFIEKDTVVNGIVYKKLSVGHEFLFGEALLREDTSVGKVWYKGLNLSPFVDPADTTERLMFDFSLQVGDSIDISNRINGMGLNSYPPIWNIVDSVKTIAGRKHIYFRGAYDWAGPPPYEPITFIEGIGSNTSPMFKHNGPTLMLMQYLLCSYKDGLRTFYNNREYGGNCMLPTSIGNGLVGANAISIVPNPTSDFLRVNYPAIEKLTSLTLYNLDGQRVAESTTSTLAVRGLPARCYVLKIGLEKRAPVYRRVVVQ